DYHELIKSRLHALADWLRNQFPEAQTRACVDTAPVMEKELAARAGLGWVGKNTCLINPEQGSWLLLGEVITTLPLVPDSPATDPALRPRFPAGTLSVDEVLTWTDDDYGATLRRSAMKRVKLPVLQRNARIVRDNLARE